MDDIFYPPEGYELRDTVEILPGNSIMWFFLMDSVNNYAPLDVIELETYLVTIPLN